MLYSIILPTYNEKENLPIIFYLIDKHMIDLTTKEKIPYEVVIVDDNSPDGTLAVAEALQKSYGTEKVSIVSRSGKLGLGTAYSAGLQKAKGQRIILMDADLSHHPKFIPQMIDRMNRSNDDNNSNHKNQGYHIVTGTRYQLGGGVAGWDLKRKVVSKGANILADFLLHPSVSDLTGSFRLYERSVLEDVLSKVTCTGYAFQMEIMVLAKKRSYRVAEVPITFVDRVYGESKLGKKEIILYIRGLLTLFFTT